MSEPSAATQPECFDPDVQWLVTTGRTERGLRELIAELCKHLVHTGLPLARMMLSMRVLHPLVAARGVIWRRGNAGCTEEYDRAHGILADTAYLQSPLRLAYENGEIVRRRLAGPEAKLDFPVLEELRNEGMTDYLVLPVRFTDGIRAVTTWATDDPKGFADGDIRRLRALIPVLALLIEVHARRDLSSIILDTYVGGAAGRRVLNGQIKRGDNESIRAVLWYCDLRNFTPLTERMSGANVIHILNEYFERMVGPVRAHGGEVMKFIGDAMLAIFPLADRDVEIACNAALKAAREAIEAMKEQSQSCAECGESDLQFGIALHIGEVIFGNIGAPDRLDFTVIGPAVNRVVRIEEMCRKLDREVLISADVARHINEPLVSVGRHELRGVGETVELFTLAKYADTRAAAE